MKNDKINRKSNIELLRLMMGVAVIVLHYNFGPSGGGAFQVSSGFNKSFLILLEVICAVAVNVFIMITGYFNCNKERINPFKAIKLLLELIVISILIYIVDCFYKGLHISCKQILTYFLPGNWFLWLYMALYIISPYINCTINLLNKNNRKRMLFVFS